MRKIKEYPLNGKLKESELRRIPKADLLILLTIIIDAGKKIKDQIDAAHAKKRAYKKPIDTVWLNSAKRSRELKKLHCKMVEKELGIRKTIAAKHNKKKAAA